MVTTLNRQDLLPIALRSVQMQSLEDWECIVVDDGSLDDTVAVARRFMDADPRFRVIRHQSRLGLPAARNTGLAMARAENVCFLDDDDFLLADSLSARLEALRGQPDDVLGAFCDWINTDPHVGLEAFRPEKALVERGQITFSSLRSGVPFIATAPMLRRRALIGLGGFDETFHRAEDSELWHRALRFGFRFLDARHVGVAYRRSPGSMVLRDPQAQIETLREIELRADAPDPHIGAHGPLPIADGLAALAAPGLRAGGQYRYAAMMALSDFDAAVEFITDSVPAPVRAEIDAPVLTRQLVSYVRARMGISQATLVFDTETTIRRLVHAIRPETTASWTPVVDVEAWLSERQQRATAARPSPQVVAATPDAVAGAVVLLVEAVYHVDEFGPLAAALERIGQRAVFMDTPKTVPGALAALGDHAPAVVEWDVDVIPHAAAVVVLNDWGPVRELVERANEAGVPTFSKVEGVQDFEDVDTGRVRRPYRTTAVVLGQGPNDLRSLPDRRVEIVGSSRLERIWAKGPIECSERVLVNLNFTYHVLTEHRERWMETVCQAVDRVGVEAVVSTHPAERSRNVGLPIATGPFRHEITKSGVLVSRFSTVPFEAMAWGVPFVYHNPHGELVPTFTRPDGAFAITSDTDQLARALEAGLTPANQDRARWRDFFAQQVDIDPEQPSEERAAEVIVSVIRESR
ncbi:MAG: glycosyltransferase family A protein [Actinomycetota bacterium]